MTERTLVDTGNHSEQFALNYDKQGEPGHGTTQNVALGKQLAMEKSQRMTEKAMSYAPKGTVTAEQNRPKTSQRHGSLEDQSASPIC